MSGHEVFLAKLAEIGREYEERLRPEQMVQSRLRWEDWETLRKEAVAFAEREIYRRKWRGSRGGVLPEGYDGEAVANQAIGEMLAGKCRLAFGWTRERLVRELKRLVSRRVRVLHRLKEAWSVRSEWEGVEAEGESMLDKVGGDGVGVDEEVMQSEEELWREGVVRRFEELLGPEPELRAIFGCLCAGATESKEIARRLGMDEASVVRGRKKLARRAGEFERRERRKGVRSV
ncbi:MAG TPA: hypothetical protein VG167_05075 [Verrucomicrobiae bacterium]|nr:hypothetical protein [Verrucomicrobiae bacterium]